MRPGQHNKRGRNRNRRHSGGGGGGGGGGNPLNRVYESNGPDVKVRGTAQTVADKYLQLGRDAQASGDIVMSESYYQHAEHYLRILAAAQAYNQQFQQQQFRRPNEEGYEDEDGEYGSEGEGDEQQPAIVERHQPFDASAEASGQPHESAERQPSGQQPQQQFRPRDQGRDRYRSRWDNRDRYEQPREDSPPRQEEAQPRVEASQPPPAEPVQANGKEGSWEAPSFLKRGSGNGSGSEPTPRTRAPRRSRREPAEASDPSRDTSSD